MKSIGIINVTKEETIANKAFIADSFFSRFKGLLGKKELKKDEALCIKPCKSIHMFFMRFSIDVIFVNNKNVVIKLIEGLKPWEISPYVKEASYVIELSEGIIKKTGIEVGDEIQLRIEN